MKIDAEELKRWIEETFKPDTLPRPFNQNNEIQTTANMIIKKLARMVKTEQKKQEGK